jgi:hypothetical protein
LVLAAAAAPAGYRRSRVTLMVDGDANLPAREAR